MTSENTALAIDLTQAILEQFWQQDTSLLLKYIDEDFSLTDALNHSIIQGQSQVCNFIPTAISGIIKSTLTDKMFIIAEPHRLADLLHPHAGAQQLARPQHPAPTVTLNPEIANFYDFTTSDLIVENYEHGPQVTNIPIAV